MLPFPALRDKVYTVLKTRRRASFAELARVLLPSAPPDTRVLVGLRNVMQKDQRFTCDREGYWRVNHRLERGIEYVVVDTETTGFAPPEHQLTEVAGVRVRAGEILDSFHSLVNPGRPIPPFISNMTGITDDMVRDQPSPEEIFPSFRRFVGDAIFVAHNAPFDLRFLNAIAESMDGHPLSDRFMCTCSLARKLLPHLPSKSLSSLAIYYDIPIPNLHRALDDATATAHLLLNLLAELESKGESAPAQFVSVL